MKTNELTFHSVRKLSIIGGFLDGFEVTFTNGLICLIGSRGTGKSTVVEMMRYALDAMPGKPGDPLRRRAESLIESNLGDGRIELVVETKNGITYTITRIFGDEPDILDEHGNSVSMRIRGALLFQADFFSQNEMETIAETPHYQLALLDKFEQSALADIQWKLEEVLQKLDTNKGLLIPAQTKMDQLEIHVKELGPLEEKLKSYASPTTEDAKKIDLAEQHKGLRDRETKALAATLQVIRERHAEAKALKGALSGDIAETIDADILAGPNKSLMQRAIQELSHTASDFDSAIATAMNALANSYKKIQLIQTELKSTHDLQEIDFRKLLETNKANQAKSAERTKLEKARNDLLFKKRELVDLAKRIKILTDERQARLDELNERRDERSEIRQKIATRLNEALMPDIKVQLLQYGDRTEYQDYLAKCLKDQGIKQGEAARKISSRVSPTELGELVKANDANLLMQKTGIPQTQANAVLRAINSDCLFDLEAIDMNDLPSIQLCDGGKYKESHELSTGQKCTAILPILMFHSANPLLVDQPEDNLDNSFVYGTIVSTVRAAKETRQMIFITHNPNIPVLGGANQILVMKSNGTNATIERVGTVDECRNQIISLLEGGEEAFKERAKHYDY